MSVDPRAVRPAEPYPGEVVLPWDEQAERAVLGAVLLDPQALDTAVEVLRPEDFHRVAHRAIFGAFGELFRRAEAIDIITVRAELERVGALESCGGAAFVASLIDGLPRVSNVSAYARIVQDKALLRKMLGVAEELRADAAAGARPAIEILDGAEKRLFDLSERGRKGGFEPISKVAAEALNLIEEMAERREPITGLATGYNFLDKMLSGFQDGDLLILAARPSMGKTALAMNIAQNIALLDDATVGIFSLEMSRLQLFQRLLSGEARVDLQKIRTGNLSQEDWDRITIAWERLSRAKIFIDDTPGVGPMEVRSKARRLKYEHDVSMIVIDYLQLMRLEGKVENRQQEVSEISRSLKAIAKELQVPVLALSQLSRAPESSRGSDHRPQLSDLRESGAIEQDADVVMFIYRPEVYEKDKEKVAALGLEGQAEVIVAKQRNGPTGKIPLYFVKEFARFENRSDF